MKITKYYIMKTHATFLTICLLGLLLGVTQLQAQEVLPFPGTTVGKYNGQNPCGL
jgi:hypothetical protein